LQVALIIDTLKPELIIASTVRHSFSALVEYTYPSSYISSPQTGAKSTFYYPALHKVSEN
jgi:hypothetical protein